MTDNYCSIDFVRYYNILINNSIGEFYTMAKNFFITCILGTFILDEQIRVVKHIPFSDISQWKEKQAAEEKVKKEFPAAEPLPPEGLHAFLRLLARREYFPGFHLLNKELTKEQVRQNTKEDMLILQSVNAVDELSLSINRLISRLREWYALYNSEGERLMQDHEQFVQSVIRQTKEELFKSLGIPSKNAMGISLGAVDVGAIQQLAKDIHSLQDAKKRQEAYLEQLMKKICPNLTAIAGFLIGARLLEQAGSLKNLMEFPASTIQILGAEKALFRHMKTGAKSPRHGFIAHHPLIASAPQALHGKIARALADKMSLAVKMDYFKGKFIGDKLLEEVQKRFS